MRSGIADIPGERHRGRHTEVLTAEVVRYVMTISKCAGRIMEMEMTMAMGVWAAEPLLCGEIPM